MNRNRPELIEEDILTDVDSWGKRFYNHKMRYYPYPATKHYMDWLERENARLVKELKELNNNND